MLSTLYKLGLQHSQKVFYTNHKIRTFHSYSEQYILRYKKVHIGIFCKTDVV